MKPYPTYAEVITAMGRSGRTVEFMQALIEKACDIDRTRREAPAESIPWAEHPWAKWAAKDADGGVWLFEVQPIHAPNGGNYWVEYSSYGGTEKEDNATIPGPWQESLRARPEGV